ncbi:MAG: hypothetical protein ACLFSM_08250 [Thermoplasmata archaeon]
MWDRKTIKETSVFILLAILVFVGSTYLAYIIVDYTNNWIYGFLMPFMLLLYASLWIIFVEL